MNLPSPFNTFRLEKRPGEYKAFHGASDSSYPLKGVTYPTNYGDIEGYTGEDGKFQTMDELLLAMEPFKNED